jgi:serine/threonine protein kinase
MALATGTRLASYEILSPLGAGGMGEVYRARDTKLGRDVAIKVLPAEFAQDADRMARFAREAQVLASLNHSCSASHMTLAGVSLAGASGRTASNGNSNIVYRKTGTGSGWVFSIGSLSSGGVLAIDPTLQRVVQNAFDAAIAGVAP